MKKIYVFLIGILVLGLASCSTDDSTTNATKSAQVALNASINTGNTGSTRVTESDKDNVFTTAWGTGDALSVSFADDTSNPMSLNWKASNDFIGEVTDTQAQQFAKGDSIYGFNYNTNSNITLGSPFSASVDFTGQNGACDNIAKYDLMYGKGDPSKIVSFNHQICVLRLDFNDTQLSGTITDASFSFTSSNNQSLFANKADYTFNSTTHNADLSTTDANSLTLSNPSIAITNGQASVYLAVPARTSVSGTLAIKLTCTSGTYTKNITLTDKNFPSATVQTKIITSLEKGISVGDYVYSDGTWGSNEKDSNGNEAIGVLISDSLSQEEKDAGATHGYVMSLTEVQPNDIWGPKEGAAALPSPLKNYKLGEDTQDFNSGYDGTYKDLHLGTDSNYPAWEAAYNYNTTYPLTNFPKATGWYLPTAGQWSKALKVSEIISSISKTDQYNNPINAGYYNGYWTSTTIYETEDNDLGNAAIGFYQSSPTLYKSGKDDKTKSVRAVFAF